MKKQSIQALIAALALLWTTGSWAAASMQYMMRVDGLACPYCAYGIEKKLNQIKGVEHVDVDLKKGIVIVDVAEGVKLQPEQMKKLFKDAGFTYRSMERKPL